MFKEIYVTGDTHGCNGIIDRFNRENFQPDDDSIVFIAGDFGAVWDFDARYLPDYYKINYFQRIYYQRIHGPHGEAYDELSCLDWLAQKPFTVCFCPGNHENYDRLYRAYPHDKWCGGNVIKLRNNVLMLENGERFDLGGFSVLSLGGARSIDITDGIIEPDEFSNFEELNAVIDTYTRRGKNSFRINHMNWWEDEIPSIDQLHNFVENSKKYSDLVLTHDAPSNMCLRKPTNLLRKTLNQIHDIGNYKFWCAGHHHVNKRCGNDMILYKDIVRIV